MRAKLKIKDEYGSGQIHVGQLFDVCVWAGEWMVLFGQYSRDGKVRITEYDRDTGKFRPWGPIEVKEFTDMAGFNYCDLVILHIYERQQTVEDVIEQMRKDYQKEVVQDSSQGSVE